MVMVTVEPDFVLRDGGNMDPGTGKDIRVMSASKRTEFGVGGENRVGRGRVAELMKTFSVSSDSTCSQPTPRSNKPPVPNKPSHLQHLPSHSFR
ncbi:SH2 domain-containing protein 4A isoform X1 [Tachysurus ichikawai]